MLSIAEWTDRALALSSPMKLTSSASFSPSIRISLRLKIHQAQAKNFCRVLDIRVPQSMEGNHGQLVRLGLVCIVVGENIMQGAVGGGVAHHFPVGLGEHPVITLPEGADFQSVTGLLVF